jgi:serine/threonine protein phosphatase PrpC
MSTAQRTAAAACPACGAAIAPDDSFCEACGTELAPAAVSAGPPAAAAACPSCPGAAVSPDGYCDSCGRKVPSGRDHAELDLGVIAGVTDRGLRHHRNEDAMALAVADLAGGPAAVAVVSDGISTSDRPDEASLAAAQAVVDVLLGAVRTGRDLEEACRAATQSAADAVQALAGESADQPCATLIAAVVTQDAVTVCWLGDSRAYWLAGPGAQRLTRDDSLAEEMVAAGLLSESAAMASPHAHVVTRWLGGDAAAATPHVLRFEPPGPGALLLCSDGLWNYRTGAEQLAALALPQALADPLGAAGALVKVALDAGGMDNITAVLVPFPPTRRAAPAQPHAATRPA